MGLFSRNVKSELLPRIEEVLIRIAQTLNPIHSLENKPEIQRVINYMCDFVDTNGRVFYPRNKRPANIAEYELLHSVVVEITRDLREKKKIAKNTLKSLIRRCDEIHDSESIFFNTFVLGPRQSGWYGLSQSWAKYEAKRRVELDYEGFLGMNEADFNILKLQYINFRLPMLGKLKNLTNRLKELV